MLRPSLPTVPDRFMPSIIDPSVDISIGETSGGGHGSDRDRTDGYVIIIQRVWCYVNGMRFYILL